MKLNRIIALGVVLMFACLIPNQSPGQAASEAQDSQQDVSQLVSVLDHVWLDAARNHDTGTMAWVFSDHFIELHNGGNAVSKARQTGQIRSSATDLTELYPSDIQVRYVSPDVAILTDTTNIQGTRDGQNIGGKYHVLRVFDKENGRWRAAAAGLTLIGAQPPSTGKPENAPGNPPGILSQGIQSATAEQVAELDRQWLHAALTRNTDYMAALFSDDFVEIHPGGEIVTKQQQIDQIKSSTHKMTELRPVDIHVHYLSPDLAILTDTTIKKGSSEGVNQTGSFRVLRIFVKQNGKWRAAGAAQTPVATGIMVTGNG
ncbi:MAG: nuclear transport factor 2 family protein [Terriglobia bacterium]